MAEDEAGLGERVGGHADIAEASIMLALHSDRVQQDQAAPGYLGNLDSEVLRKMTEEGIHSITLTLTGFDPLLLT